jgi:hypothetical protein
VPPLDALPFPVNSYTKGAHASLRAAHRQELLKHAWELPFVVLGAALTVAITHAFSGDWDQSAERQAHADASNMLTDWLHARRATARDVVWDRLLRVRGMNPVAVPRTPDWQDMRRVADWIRFDHMGGPPQWSAEGEVYGMPATVGELCFERRNEEGRRTRSMRMFAAFSIPPAAAARHPHVTVRKRGLPLLGDRVGGHEVQFESTAVTKSMVIRVDADADAVSTRELFGPQLIAELAEQAVCWDQRGSAVVVWMATPAEPGPVLDGFCRAAAAVARAYYADQR